MVPFVLDFSTEHPKEMESLFRLDWIGIILFFSSTCALRIGLVGGGTEHPWRSWRTILPLQLGVMGTLFTVFWEMYTPKPFLRISLFNSFAACTAYFSAALQGLLVSIRFYPKLIYLY